MGKFVSKAVREHYKRVTQQVIKDLSQPFYIIQETPNFVDCPNCIWDSINKKSSNVFNASFVTPITVFSGTDQQRLVSPISFTDSRCPVCLGEGQLFTARELCIHAMVNFVRPGDSGAKYYDLPAGKEGVNFAIIKTQVCFYDLLARNDTFIIHNNIKCEKYRPPMVRGLGGDPSIVEMVVQTTESGELVSGRFDSADHPFDREDDPRRKIKGGTDANVLRGIIKGK